MSVTGGFLCMIAMLATRNMNHFNGTEVYTDKVTLILFNTVIIYGAIALVVTSFIYSLFTEWGFIKYRFVIIKWGLLLCIFAIAWFQIGSAISGMTSISDAGLHLDQMQDTYINHWKMAIIGVLEEIILLILVVIISVRKPFGKRDVKPFKHRKIMIAGFTICVMIGIGFWIQSEIRHINLRNTPIANVDVSTVADGDYEGESIFGSYTYHVRVTVQNHKITEIKDLAPRDSIYVTYATNVLDRIVKKQTPNVDAVSGATTTSKAFMKAVENALLHASK